MKSKVSTFSCCLLCPCATFPRQDTACWNHPFFQNTQSAPILVRRPLHMELFQSWLDKWAQSGEPWSSWWRFSVCELCTSEWPSISKHRRHCPTASKTLNCYHHDCDFQWAVSQSGSVARGCNKR